MCCSCLPRRQAGEPLPPPPKTAIAGPEYFGLTHPDVILRIESLDPEHLCYIYWNGKQVPQWTFRACEVQWQLVLTGQT